MRRPLGRGGESRGSITLPTGSGSDARPHAISVIGYGLWSCSAARAGWATRWHYRASIVGLQQCAGGAVERIAPARQRSSDRGSVSHARLTGRQTDAVAKRFDDASAAAISELVQRGGPRRPHDRSPPHPLSEPNTRQSIPARKVNCQDLTPIFRRLQNCLPCQNGGRRQLPVCGLRVRRD